jgi:hypothetical protein
MRRRPGIENRNHRPELARESSMCRRSHAQFTRFTDWDRTETGAEISPDGKFVAFLADRAGQFDIWLSQVGTGDFRNLTPTIAPLRPLGKILRSFGLSGDGSEIWFSEAGDAGLPKMLLPMMGGGVRAFMGRRQQRSFVVSRRHAARVLQQRPRRCPVRRRSFRRGPHADPQAR